MALLDDATCMFSLSPKNETDFQLGVRALRRSKWSKAVARRLPAILRLFTNRGDTRKCRAARYVLAVQGMDRVARLMMRKPLPGEPPYNQLKNNDNGRPGGSDFSTENQSVSGWFANPLPSYGLANIKSKRGTSLLSLPTFSNLHSCSLQRRVGKTRLVSGCSIKIPTVYCGFLGESIAIFLRARLENR